MQVPGVVAVICSLWRPGAVVHTAVSAALAEPLIDVVMVFGYEPTGAAVARTIPRTLYHSALSKHNANVTQDVLCTGNKFCTTDSTARILWRASIALDMWACLSAARNEHPQSTLVWLENDAVLIPNALGRALATAASTGAVACYGRGRRYQGSGALCFVFTPRIDPRPHILSYHLVQPVDWILFDFSRGLWPIVRAVTHGTDGKHKSTRIL